MAEFQTSFYMQPAEQKGFTSVNLFSTFFLFFLFMRPFPFFSSVFDSTPKSLKADSKANLVQQQNYKATVHSKKRSMITVSEIEYFIIHYMARSIWTLISGPCGGSKMGPHSCLENLCVL